MFVIFVQYKTNQIPDCLHRHQSAKHQKRGWLMQRLAINYYLHLNTRTPLAFPGIRIPR